MNIRKIANLATLFFAGTLITACGSSSKVTSLFSDRVDSIKVEVSTKVSTDYIMLTNSDKAIVKLKGNDESSLPAKETAKLKALAEDLFVKRTENIVLSETKANGRTSHPIFTVTLYRNDKGESSRYEMGDEADGITQGTTKNIRYSDSFREFMFSVVRILD